MKIKDLLVILVFCLVLRGLSTFALQYLFPDGYNDLRNYYLSLCAQAAMYALLCCLSAYHFGLSRTKIAKIVGDPQNSGRIFLAAALGVTLFMFSIGENSLETWSAAQFDEKLAHGISGFYTSTSETSVYTTANEYLVFFPIGIFAAPAAEEFFFRGLLFRAFGHRMSCFPAALLSSCIFALLHYKHLHLISTMAFSVGMCYIYRKTASLILCATIHSAFNLAAQIAERLFGGALLQAPQDIRLASGWLPYFILLIVSLIIIIVAAKYRKRAFGAGAPSMADFLAL